MAFRADWVLPNVYVGVGFVLGIIVARLITSALDDPAWTTTIFSGSLALALSLANVWVIRFHKIHLNWRWWTVPTLFFLGFVLSVFVGDPGL